MSLVSMLRAVAVASVRCVVVGGVAARLHGSARQTDDLDLCDDDQEENVARLTSVLASWEAYRHGWESACLAKSIPVQAFGLTVPRIVLPSLIRAKRHANRPNDHVALPELEAMAVKRGEWPLAA